MFERMNVRNRSVSPRLRERHDEVERRGDEAQQESGQGAPLVEALPEDRARQADRDGHLLIEAFRRRQVHLHLLADEVLRAAVEADRGHAAVLGEEGDKNREARINADFRAPLAAQPGRIGPDLLIPKIEVPPV